MGSSCEGDGSFAVKCRPACCGHAPHSGVWQAAATATLLVASSSARSVRRPASPARRTKPTAPAIVLAAADPAQLYKKIYLRAAISTLLGACYYYKFGTYTLTHS